MKAVTEAKYSSPERVITPRPKSANCGMTPRGWRSLARPSLKTPAASFCFDSQPGQAVNIGLLFGNFVCVQVLDNGIRRGPCMWKPKHFRTSWPVDQDVLGALEIFRTEESWLPDRER